MSDNFIEKWKKESDAFILATLERIQGHFDELWKSLVEETQKKKTELEEQSNELKKKNAKITVISEDLIKLERGVKNTTDKLDELTAKAEEMAQKVIDAEKKIEEIVAREKAVDDREKALNKEKLTFKAEKINFQEKKKRMDRAINKLQE